MKTENILDLGARQRLRAVDFWLNLGRVSKMSIRGDRPEEGLRVKNDQAVLARIDTLDGDLDAVLGFEARRRGQRQVGLQ